MFRCTRRDPLVSSRRALVVLACIDFGTPRGQTTTLTSPLRFGLIGYRSVAQSLTQQYKIGLDMELARVGVDAVSEQLRAKRQAIVKEVRHLYYGSPRPKAADGRYRRRSTS